MDAGMMPLTRFLEMSSISRLISLETEFGIWPPMELLEMSSHFSPAPRVKSGSAPVILFSDRSRCSSF
uniref:Uncharacterized protein n=1 Tax=Arundo donax TaxID=35708 RepID=A0A0A8Y1J0_ARUDO